MTIQQRSHRASERFDRPDYEPDYSPLIQRMAAFSISVYREAKDKRLNDVIQRISDNCPSYIIGKRGEGYERIGPAVNILESNESRRILEFSSLAFQVVNNHLYNDVPSLRTTKKIETDGVEIFGWDHSPYKSIGITIKDPTYSEISDERCNVIDKMNELVFDKETGLYCYVKPKTLHLSLAKIETNTPEIVIERTKEAVRAAMPADLLLSKAVIFKNVTKG